MRQIDAFEHEGQFRKTEHTGYNTGIGLNGKPECTFFETLIIQTITAMVPRQDFYPVSITVDEHKQMA